MFKLYNKEVDRNADNQNFVGTEEIDGIEYNIWEISANSKGKTLNSKVAVPKMEDIVNLEEDDIKAVYNHFLAGILTDSKNKLRRLIKSDEELKAERAKALQKLEAIDSMLEG